MLVILGHSPTASVSRPRSSTGSQVERHTPRLLHLLLLCLCDAKKQETIHPGGGVRRILSISSTVVSDDVLEKDCDAALTHTPVTSTQKVVIVKAVIDWQHDGAKIIRRT